jgi:hypothetical protein
MLDTGCSILDENDKHQLIIKHPASSIQYHPRTAKKYRFIFAIEEHQSLFPKDYGKEDQTNMKNSLWLIIVIVVGFTGFLIGYSVSSYTGYQTVDKGYAGGAEAGGYGGEAGGYGAEAADRGTAAPGPGEASESYGERTSFFGD